MELIGSVASAKRPLLIAEMAKMKGHRLSYRQEDYSSLANASPSSSCQLLRRDDRNPAFAIAALCAAASGKAFLIRWIASSHAKRSDRPQSCDYVEADLRPISLWGNLAGARKVDPGELDVANFDVNIGAATGSDVARELLQECRSHADAVFSPSLAADRQF